MSTLDADLIKLIDQRIRAAQHADRAQGTCVERDTTGRGAQVIFDGSTVAMPVWVVGSVYLEPGMRCVLDRYGTQWVVAGSPAHPSTMGAALFNAFGPVGATSATTSSYIDFPNFSFTFTKTYDLTIVRCMSACSAYTNSAPTQARFALRFTAVDAGNPYVSTDIEMAHNYWTSIGHMGFSAEIWIDDMPAGSYTVQVRWKKITGGNVNSNELDFHTYTVVESASPDAPSL